MSAYIVNQAHIRALVNAGLAYNRPGSPLRWQWESDPDPEELAGAYQRGSWTGPRAMELYARRVHELTPATAQSVGQMLLAENHRSVGWRYAEQSDPEEYRHARTPVRPPVAILKALDGLEYQACESPEWKTSQAQAFCDALRRAACRALAGYEDAEWEIIEDWPPVPPGPVAWVAREVKAPEEASRQPPPPATPPAPKASLSNKQETAVVRRALRAAGLTVLHVGHGRGTGYGWLHVSVKGPAVPRREDGSMDSQTPEFAEYERIEKLARRTIVQATDRDTSKDDSQSDYFHSRFLVDVTCGDR